MSVTTSQARRVANSAAHLYERLEAKRRELETAKAAERARAQDIEERRRYRAQMRNQADMAELQSRADAALSGWNIRAPAPSADDDERSYRLRLLHLCERQLPVGHELRNLNLGACESSVIAKFEPMIFAACASAVADSATVPEGEMRRVKEQIAGAEHTRFIGKKSFVVDMQPASSRVTGWAQRDGNFLR